MNERFLFDVVIVMTTVGRPTWYTTTATVVVPDSGARFSHVKPWKEVSEIFAVLLGCGFSIIILGFLACLLRVVCLPPPCIVSACCGAFVHIHWITSDQDKTTPVRVACNKVLDDTDGSTYMLLLQASLLFVGGGSSHPFFWAPVSTPGYYLLYHRDVVCVGAHQPALGDSSSSVAARTAFFLYHRLFSHSLLTFLFVFLRYFRSIVVIVVLSFNERNKTKFSVRVRFV